jgi:hypothetical protein
VNAAQEMMGNLAGIAGLIYAFGSHITGTVPGLGNAQFAVSRKTGS